MGGPGGGGDYWGDSALRGSFSSAQHGAHPPTERGGEPGGAGRPRQVNLHQPPRKQEGSWTGGRQVQCDADTNLQHGASGGSDVPSHLSISGIMR